MIWEENDEARDIFYAEMAKHCRCCGSCSPRPCDGVCAGGMCDEARCSCDDDYEPDRDEERP